MGQLAPESAIALAPRLTEKAVLSVCPHDCPDTCAMISHVADGRLLRVEGNPSHPYTRGTLCRKVAHYEERVYSPDRLLYPMVRCGPKGSGRFERVSWDHALDLIADRWRTIIAESGPEAILPYSYAGTMGVVNMSACEGRLWNRMGASRLLRTICSTAGEAGHTYTMGWSGGIDPESFAHSKLIIAWGTNLSSTNVHLMPFVREAQKNGAKFVVIDPFKTRTAGSADLFLQLKPGTDTALALGMMHVILEEGLYDGDYVARYTVGIDALRDRAREFPPDRVASITGLPEDVIVDFARSYATVKPSAIRLGYGLTRNSNGGMMARAITCLPALVGAWRHLGGGLLLSSSSHFGWNRAAVMRPDLRPAGPLPRAINMNELGAALAGQQNPPVRSMMIWNCNPAAVAPNSNLVIDGLMRDDLFTVVHEQLMTDTARYADVLLPATSQMEHLDLHFSYGQMYVQLNQPAIEPLGECRPNIDVQNDLARRMGYMDACFSQSAEEVIRTALSTDDPSMSGVTYERLLVEGSIKIGADSSRGLVKSGDLIQTFADGQGFRTPSGKVEFYSEKALEEGYDPLPAYVPLAESHEATPELAREFPLNLLSPASHHFLNSTFSNLPSLMKAEKAPRIWIHPEDAVERDISSGDVVRVHNLRGEVELRAEVSELAQPGTVWSPSLWWHRDSPKGRNVNALTSDLLTDLGGGSTFHTNLVQVERKR